jgi:hypothetical protein
LSTDLALRTDLLVRLEETGWLGPVGLRIDDPRLSFERYEALGVLLGRVGSAVRWAVGDWLAFGEQLYGERAAQASEALGMSPEGRQEAIRVALAIPRSHRRPSLSWGTHRACAAKWIDPAQRQELLDRAEREGWGTREMAAAVKDLRTLGLHVEDVRSEDECPDLDEVAAEVRDRLRSCYGEVRVQISAPGVTYSVEEAE